MSWRSSQNSNLVVNDLTVNGKFTFTNDPANPVVIPDDIICNTITSVDGTNEVDLSTADELSLRSGGGIYCHNSLFMNNHPILNAIKITGNGGILAIDSELNVSDSSNLAGITTITNTTDSTAVGNGAMIVDGGLSIAKSTRLNGTLNVTGNVGLAGVSKVTNTTNSTASTNGALVVSGGVGVEKDLYIGGNIHCTGTVQSSNSDLYQEFHSYHLTGSRGTPGGTITLNTPQGNTNYMVFPSVYYGFSGSGGTYDANGTSGDLHGIVINTITTNSFSWTLQKESTADNVNVYLVFWVIFSSQLSFPKSYSS